MLQVVPEKSNVSSYNVASGHKIVNPNSNVSFQNANNPNKYPYNEQTWETSAWIDGIISLFFPGQLAFCKKSS